MKEKRKGKIKMSEEKLDFLIKQNYAMQKMIQALFIYEGMDIKQLKHTLDLIEEEMKEEGNWRDE